MRPDFTNMSTKSNPLPSIATVGFFDGVHAGHRFLLEELKSLAQDRNLDSLIVTFSTHPRKVLNPDFHPELLTLLSEKLQQIETMGIDSCVVLDFTLEMAHLSAFDFLKTVLKEQLNVKTLVVGHDHRFGHNRAEDITDYKRYGELLGMEVIQAQQYTTLNDLIVSSSVIRKTLQMGDVELANRLLTYQYSIRGKVVEGFKVGRKIGFPTANLQIFDSTKLIPGHGVYAVVVHWNGAKYPAMMNIGTRPTLNNGDNTSLEVHLLDFNEDIYSHEITVEFIRKIRDEKKMNGLTELIEQLTKDKATVSSMNL